MESSAAGARSERGAIGWRRFSLPPQARYLLITALTMAALYAAFYYPYAADHPTARLIQAYLRLLAFATERVIALFDSAVSVNGTLINGRFPLLIVKSCSALDAQALYVGAVLAFPAPLRAKLIGLIAGIAVLTLINLGRLATLYFVGAYAPASFDTLHEELFPLVIVALACLCFVLWIRWARERPQTS